ncbi:hypothetical protein BDW62DRAFT_203188 [Aspergillus aurantiobrunneus]
MSIENLSGNWVVDKSRTTKMDAAPKLQGTSWLRRKAVTSGTITLRINQAPTDESTRITTQQGLRGSTNADGKTKPEVQIWL